jgi:hypothetical protein
MSESRLPDGCLGRCALSETFRSKSEEIQTQAPPLRLRVCPATGNARSINANYIRGGVNKFSNPLSSILKRAAYQGTRVRQLVINAKDVVALTCRGTEQNRTGKTSALEGVDGLHVGLQRKNLTLEVSSKPMILTHEKES